MRYKLSTGLLFLQSTNFSIFIILLFHVSGFIGMQTSYRQWFIDLTPLNLLVSVAMLLRHELKNKPSVFIFATLIFLGGYFVEVVGVNTGLIFGKYTYGPVLGLKLAETPLLIGVNWLILVFCIGLLLNPYSIPNVFKALIGALVMTTIDYIIEPVAIQFNFWTWNLGTIPLQNYVAWYIFSFLFLFIFYQFNFTKSNKVAPWLLVTQVIFFLLLNFLI